jgi:chromosome segregation ATPase
MLSTRVSTDLLSKINAKIDSVMANQTKLLDITSQPSTIISGPVNREESTDRQLSCMWTEIEKLHREMAEQKLFYENQLAESKAEAARQETKLEKVQTTLTNKMTSYENQLAESRSGAEEELACLKIELEKMRGNFSALQKSLTTKISELAEQKAANEISKSKVDDKKAEFHRIIDLAFEEHAKLEQTEEKVVKVDEKFRRLSLKEVRKNQRAIRRNVM